MRSFCILFILVTSAPLFAADYYVSPLGDDGNPGTLALPFATITRGQTAASAGDTVFLRGGVYSYSGITGPAEAVLFNKSGTSVAPIKYFAYQNETPVFDFFNYQPVQRIKGFSVQADWLHFRGIELRGVQQIITTVNESWGIRVENGADNNVFERLNLHHNEGPGFFIADGGNNLVINTDSHHNYDPDRNGENADGFGSHSNDNGNTFIGNRAWWNSDDGFDFINSPGVATVKDSWAWRNGFIPDTTTPIGNGAGIKAGGFTTSTLPTVIPRHKVIGNISFLNRRQGFYANHHDGGLDFINNTAYNNPSNFDLEDDDVGAEHFLRNNIAFTGNSIVNADLTSIDSLFNSWDGSTGVTITTADFLTLIMTGVDGPRQANGALPFLNYLRLALGSDAIDAGVFVSSAGRHFLGLSPDLGAFEVPEPGTISILVFAGAGLLLRRRVNHHG